MSYSPDQLRAALVGVIGFPVTPFREDLSVDLPALRANLRTMLRQPLAAVVAAGGTGELYSLTPAEHLEVVRTVVEEVEGKIPVIAGTGFNAALGAELARQAAGCGAAGILAFPPYYPAPEDDGIVGYYGAIGAATPLGLLVYSRDWFHPGAALVERLADIPTLVGWKDGQGDMRRLQIIRRQVGARLHWIGGAGDDLVPAYYAQGIRAFTSSIANVSPEIAVQLHLAGSTGDAATLAQLMADYVVPVYALRARRKGYEVTVMKELMNVLGLSGGFVRPPLVALRAEELREIRALVPQWQKAVTA
ncbi:MAG: dihydrodipicolinate synthase family protein [Acidobacteriota bacterium]|nr:dihydrodipicolinate synthase family protein [Acidobacteriota bacterium]